MSIFGKIFFTLLIIRLFPQLFQSFLWLSGSLTIGLFIRTVIKRTEFDRRNILAGDPADYAMLDLTRHKITWSFRPWKFNIHKRDYPVSGHRFEIAIGARYLTTRW